MIAWSRYESAAAYLVQAQHALRLAEASAGQPWEKMWVELARSWEFLARLQLDPCFCGEQSVGYKYFFDGRKLAVCGQHMTEFIVESTLRQTTDKKPH